MLLTTKTQLTALVLPKVNVLITSVYMKKYEIVMSVALHNFFVVE